VMCSWTLKTHREDDAQGISEYWPNWPPRVSLTYITPDGLLLRR
jgi:hypothetical protein